MQEHLTTVSALQREVSDFIHANAAKSRTPDADIALALAEAAAKLLALAKLSDMPVAYRHQAMRESAAMFAGFLPEVCRPLDDMFRKILRAAADNIGGFSPIEQKELEESHIVTEIIHDNWFCHYQLAAIGASTEPKAYGQRYARALVLASRSEP